MNDEKFENYGERVGARRRPHPFSNMRNIYQDQLAGILGTSLLAYWPMWEYSGPTAFDWSGNGHNAVYMNATPNGDESVFVKPCPTFDGVTDVVKPYSAELAAAFNKSEGCAGCYFLPTAGDWVALKYPMRIGQDDNNVREIRTQSPNLEIYARNAGTLNSAIVYGVTGLTAWTHILLSWSVANNRTQVFINGTLNRTGITHGGVYVGTLDSGGCGIGASNLLGGSSWIGSISDAFLATREPTEAEAWALAFADGQVIFDGDSRTNGKICTGGSWVTAMNGTTKRYGLGCYSVSGKRIATLVTDAAAKVDIRYRTPSDIVVIWAGVNDTGDTANTIYNNLKTYCLARKAIGFKTVVCSEIDCQDAARNAWGWHGVVWPALNALLAADHSFADGYADLGSNAHLQNALDATYFDADKLHLTTAGYNEVSGVIGPVLAALI